MEYVEFHVSLISHQLLNPAKMIMNFVFYSLFTVFVIPSFAFLVVEKRKKFVLMEFLKNMHM